MLGCSLRDPDQDGSDHDVVLYDARLRRGAGRGLRVDPRDRPRGAGAVHPPLVHRLRAVPSQPQVLSRAQL